MRLLLAEDEKDLSKALVAILKHNNYSVDAVYDGQQALDYAVNGDYDGIILDIMMPKKDGIQVLESLRNQGNKTPVLLLTAKSELEDRVTGLDAGADDYVPKPFEMEELLARVRAMLRRKSDYKPDVLELGETKLDRSVYTLSGPKGTVRLGNKEFQMLEMLMTNTHCIISVSQFMEKIWGWDSETEMNVVWVYISYLRKKLGEIGADTEIRATRGVGYSLEEKK